MAVVIWQISQRSDFPLSTHFGEPSLPQVKKLKSTPAPIIIREDLLPPAFSLREIAILRAIATYEPLYHELCRIGGAENLTEMIAMHSTTELMSIVDTFLHRKELPKNCTPVDGAYRPVSVSKARRDFIIWAAHQNTGGGYKPWQRAFDESCDAHKALSLDVKHAVFASRTWDASRLADFSWGSVGRSAHVGLEGSYRALKGYMFESGGREGTHQAIDFLSADFRVETKETLIKKNGKERRIDIVVHTPRGSLYMPHKSTEIPSQSHSKLFITETNQCLMELGVPKEDALIVLGGQGWEGVVQFSYYDCIIISDCSVIDEDLIDRVKNAILDNGILQRKMDTNQTRKISQNQNGAHLHTSISNRKGMEEHGRSCPSQQIETDRRTHLAA